MYLLGYSLDNLSLMALTLSVGFVVDDAIVMLENIVRHMEMGKTADDRRRSTGRRRSRFTIVAMTLSLDRGLHPGAVHGRRRRTAAARVRGDDRRRDSGVGLRVDQPDADAVQPLPQAAAQPDARLVYNAIERMFDAWLRVYDAHAAAGAALQRGHRWPCRSRC